VTLPIPSLSEAPFEYRDGKLLSMGHPAIPIMFFKDHNSGFNARLREWLAYKSTFKKRLARKPRGK